MPKGIFLSGFTQLQEETNNKNENNGDISIENDKTINQMKVGEQADISLYNNNNNTDKDFINYRMKNKDKKNVFELYTSLNMTTKESNNLNVQ